MKRKLVGFILLILCCLLVPQVAEAAPYGEGEYGAGLYGETSTPTPTPSPTATPSSSDNSGSSGNSNSAPDTNESCSAAKPDSTPDLFQISTRSNSMTLFFSPSSGNRDKYQVVYGLQSGAEQYSFEFSNDTNGVISVEVNGLSTNTAYFYKVRAMNSCQPGDWSNELAGRTGQIIPSYRWGSLARAITTNVVKQVNPSAVSRMRVDSTKVGTVSETKVVAPSEQQQAPSSDPVQPPPQQQQSISFFEKIANFFRGLIK